MKLYAGCLTCLEIDFSNHIADAVFLYVDQDMAEISFIKPCDQPEGNLRLLECLRELLASDEFDDLKIVVAFAKIGPLLRLLPEIEKWIAKSKTIQAVFGIDHSGTSLQALDFALAHFNDVYVVHATAPFSPTFHPKVYIFSGSRCVTAYIGSNNLTVGGTETNFEACTSLSMHIPEDRELIDDVREFWDDALKFALKLDPSLLSQLANDGLLLDETEGSTSQSQPSGKKKPDSQVSFPKLKCKPASPIPAGIARAKRARKTLVQKKKITSKAKTPSIKEVDVPTINARNLVIQIIPHHNGEIFLSKTAVDQDPAFFGWPFTGQTTPKKAGNPPYPQREPDPIVTLSVFDSDDKIVLKHNSFNLNTIYYATKSEIRITVPPDVVRNVPPDHPYPIMVMSLGEADLDYEINIFLSGSNSYDQYLDVCNQSMPSGGKSVPRKFGWL